MSPARADLEALDDAELVARSQTGDRAALELLLERHHDRVRAVAGRLLGNPADAADATQEALIAIVRGLRRFDGRSRFSTWVYRVTTNACLDELRRKRRRPVPVDEADPGRVPVGAATLDRGAGIVERMVLERALAGLPEDFRVPVVLRDVADLDYAEIAEVLDIPVGTVKSRIARGRAQLATVLGNPTPPTERPTPRTDPTP